MCAGHPSLVHLRGARALQLLLLNRFRPSVHVRWAPLACTPEECPAAFVVESIVLPSMCAGHPSLVHLRGAQVYKRGVPSAHGLPSAHGRKGANQFTIIAPGEILKIAADRLHYL
eukprot:scaffold103960_cov51-Phaeocystis_antarctica.AAC.1